MAAYAMLGWGMHLSRTAIAGIAILAIALPACGAEAPADPDLLSGDAVESERPRQPPQPARGQIVGTLEDLAGGDPAALAAIRERWRDSCWRWDPGQPTPALFDLAYPGSEGEPVQLMALPGPGQTWPIELLCDTGGLR